MGTPQRRPLDVSDVLVKGEHPRGEGSSPVVSRMAVTRPGGLECVEGKG